MNLLDLWFRHHHDDDASKALEAAHRDRPKVEEVATRAEQLEERNGFAEAISRAMGRNP